MGESAPPTSAEAGLARWNELLRMGAPGGLGGLLALFVVLLAAFSIGIPGFASRGTLQSIMFQMPELGLLSLAMVVPLISGGLNLAIVATSNQCALLMAFTMKTLAADGSPVVLTILAALAVGLVLSLLIGFLTGALIAYTGVHPILVTLGTKSLIDGISIYLTRGTVISGIPDAYGAAGNGYLLGMPAPFIVLILVAAAVAVLLKRTPFGISVFMVGSNIEATRYSAIDTRRVLVGVYVTSSALCFVAACLMLARFNSASAEYAQSYLLVTILAAVLGGIDPFGGFGRIVGLMLALAVLQIISSGCNLLGVNNYITLAIWGLTLVAVMAAQTLRFAFSGRVRRA